MSVIPEPRHFQQMMPMLPQRNPERGDEARTYSHTADDSVALAVTRPKWGLTWVLARSHWPR
jgi:hypothetical protein